MAILTTGFAGEVDVKPATPRLYAPTDNYATITAAGYINKVQGAAGSLNPSDIIMAYYEGGRGLFYPSFSGQAVTLNPLPSSGEVILPVVDGNFPEFDGTLGVMKDSGIAISSALLTTSTATDYQMFVPLQPCVTTDGTWTLTRISQGILGWVKTPASDSTILTFDITPYLRTTALQGLSLTSLSCAFSIETANIVSHEIELTSTTFVTSVAPALTGIPLQNSGIMGTVAQGTPIVTNLAVTTPAYLTAANTKMTAEIYITAALTSDYTFYGINLFFTKTVK